MESDAPRSSPKKITGNAATPGTSGPARAPRTPPRFFELIPRNPGIDFVRLAPTTIVASLLAIVIGLASIWFRGGLNYGIDFVGGTMVEVRFPKATPIADVRAALAPPRSRPAASLHSSPRTHLRASRAPSASYAPR